MRALRDGVRPKTRCPGASGRRLAGVPGPMSRRRSRCFGGLAGVAQLAEQRFCKPQVAGSSPSASTPKCSWIILDTFGTVLYIAEHPCRSGPYGGLPEWPKGAGCKPAGVSPTLVQIQLPPLSSAFRAARGNSSVGRASAFQAEGRGFESRFPLFSAHVAQMVEHVLGKDEVTGSSPVMGSIQRTAEVHSTSPGAASAALFVPSTCGRTAKAGSHGQGEVRSRPSPT